MSRPSPSPHDNNTSPHPGMPPPSHGGDPIPKRGNSRDPTMNYNDHPNSLAPNQKAYPPNSYSPAPVHEQLRMDNLRIDDRHTPPVSSPRQRPAQSPNLSNRPPRQQGSLPAPGYPSDSRGQQNEYSFDPRTQRPGPQQTDYPPDSRGQQQDYPPDQYPQRQGSQPSSEYPPDSHGQQNFEYPPDPRATSPQPISSYGDQWQQSTYGDPQQQGGYNDLQQYPQGGYVDPNAGYYQDPNAGYYSGQQGGYDAYGQPYPQQGGYEQYSQQGGYNAYAYPQDGYYDPSYGQQSYPQDAAYGPPQGYYQNEYYAGPDPYAQVPGSYGPGPGMPPSRPPPPKAPKRPQFPPATVENINAARQQAQTSNDPAQQLNFAKYLLYAAGNYGAGTTDEADIKRIRKVREGMILEAQKLVKKLATQGMGLGRPAYPEAMFFLANCYGNGKLGLGKEPEKAFNLYVQASKQNHPEATYRVAVCYELGAGTKRDAPRAVQFYRKAAALSDKMAMFKLGMIYLNGLLSQQKNPAEGITWLKRAAKDADEENPHALHELGLAYEKPGIPTIIPDEAYARELFTQAAQLGYAPSQFKLGYCYEYGILTCPNDPRRSIAWYTRAAEQGDPEAELALSGWYLTGSEGVLKQSDTEAYLWARKAADKALAKAEYAVGYYSEVGIGVRQDTEEARKWYMRSAAQGNKRSMQRLTELKKAGLRPAQRQQQYARGKGAPPAEDDNCVVM